MEVWLLVISVARTQRRNNLSLGAHASGLHHVEFYLHHRRSHAVARRILVGAAFHQVDHYLHHRRSHAVARLILLGAAFHQVDYYLHHRRCHAVAGLILVGAHVAFLERWQQMISLCAEPVKE